MKTRVNGRIFNHISDVGKFPEKPAGEKRAFRIEMMTGGDYIGEGKAE